MDLFGQRVFSKFLPTPIEIGRRKRRFFTILCILLVVVGLFILFYLYKAMNYEMETQLSSLLTSVHKIHFESRKNYRKNDTLSTPATRAMQDYCGEDDSTFSGCAYWNPSIFPLNPRRYLIAVRESTRQNCGGVIGTLMTLSRLFFKPAISNILIGSFNPNELMLNDNNQFTVYLRQKLPDSFDYDPNAYHYGQEDPKWISDGDRLYLLTASERHIRPRLFLTKVTLIQCNADKNADDYDKDLVEFGNTIELKPSFDAPYAQKNWMHVPVSAQDKPKDHPHWLLFVYHISPVLQLVWVDPESGNAKLLATSPHSITLANNMRGSSAFIPETANTYLAFIHTAKPHPMSYGDLQLNIYYSYLIRLAREPIKAAEPWKWTITHRTPPLAMPIAKNVRAHRIQFPTTIIEHDSEFWISMGDMDCDSHILRIPKTTLLQLLY